MQDVLEQNDAQPVQQALRHELKYQITPQQYKQLRALGRSRLQMDPYTTDGIYLVRSLYFDTRQHKDYQDTMDSAFARHKMRLRTYGNDQTLFRLEQKFKKGGLSGKRSVLLSPAQAVQVANGNYTCLQDMAGYGPKLYKILMRDCYTPALTVNYWRDVFFLPENNFRMTLDWDVCYGGPQCFLHPETAQLIQGNSPIVLEVKFNTAPPTWLNGELEKIGVQLSKNSKYCRGMQKLYGKADFETE